MPPSICIVIPYFGQWPKWMPFFLASCRENPDINWLLYSDCGIPDLIPANVRYIDIKFSNYCDLIERALMIRFSPKNPYKLCDIKPALGLIHAKEIAEYDFWGWGDLDLVYGDLRSYFDEERLAKFDLFSTHARRVSGHLCLVRNTSEMRKAFMRVHDWKEKFEMLQHIGFDEKAFSKIFIRNKNSPSWYRWLLSTKNKWMRRGQFVEAFTTPYRKITWTDGTMNFPKVWRWRNGKLFNELDGPREFPYFHFVEWKKSFRFFPNIQEYSQGRPITSFSISELGFEIEDN